MFPRPKYKLVCTKNWSRGNDEFSEGQVITYGDEPYHGGGPNAWVQEDGCAEWVENLPSLAEVQAEKWEEIKAARSVAQYQPLLFEGMLFDFDKASQDALSGAISAAQTSLLLSQPMPEVEWTLADNTSTTLTAIQLLGILSAGLVRTNAIFSAARELRDEIYKEGATAESIAAVAWV